MPELPEVETIRRDLQRLIVGKKILDITTDSAKQARLSAGQVQPSLVGVKKTITGATIKKISRRAKTLLIYLSNGKALAVHLKLTGRLLFRKKKDPADDWVRVVIILSGGRELRFADLRKFGWIRLVDKKGLQILLNEFGPEPMDDLTLAEFKKILSSSRRPVKVVLMDQKKISGVGNIYAADALFLARLDPRRPANRISLSEAGLLYQAIEKVLKAGIKYRGASDQYYLDALAHKGGYQDHFLVYGREGKKCFQCRGKVKKIKLAGRGTYFCPECQG